MISRSLVKVDSERKKALYPLRAKAFHGKLTEEEYVRRNHHIYETVFARENIHTYALVGENGDILSSCELLDVDFTFRAEQGISTSKGAMIAAVVTPEEHRGAGHCTFLLNEVFKERGDENRLLFSDIDPAFYARMGFVLGQTQEWQVASRGASKKIGGVPISIAELAGKLSRHRKQILETSPVGSVVLTPSAHLLEWHVERYRFYDRMRNKRTSGDVAYEIQHCEGQSHLFFGIANYITGLFDCLWLEKDCSQCFDFALSKATASGLMEITLWSPTPPPGGKDPHPEKPMLRFIDLRTPLLLDAQPCDYW